MKLCYDLLDEVTLSRNGFFRRKNVSYVYKEQCKNCGDPYLIASQHKGAFCSKSCAAIYKPSEEENIKKTEQIKIRKIKNKQYFELVKKGKTHPLYDRYIILIPYYDIIRNPVDKDLLQIKCLHCSVYYEPTLNKLKTLRGFVNGNETKKINTGTFCCAKHYRAFYTNLNKIKKNGKY